MITSTFLTLIVIPVVYVIFSNVSDRLAATRMRRRAPGPLSPSASGGRLQELSPN